jgi:hypothetical protein
VTALVGELLTAVIRRMHEGAGSVVVMEGTTIGIVTSATCCAPQREVLRRHGGCDDGAGRHHRCRDPVANRTGVDARSGYRHMPVTDHGHPVGVVSLRTDARVIGPAVPAA